MEKYPALLNTTYIDIEYILNINFRAAVIDYNKIFNHESITFYFIAVLRKLRLTQYLIRVLIGSVKRAIWRVQKENPLPSNLQLSLTRFRLSIF